MNDAAEQRALLREIRDELRGVRVALETLVQALTELGGPAPPPACEHPMEARASFSGMGEADEFTCTVCGTHVMTEPVTHG